MAAEKSVRIGGRARRLQARAPPAYDPRFSTDR
jgi:DNA-directed RNA polymerase subunit K/omega